MPVYAAENLAGQLPEDPNLGPADPNPAAPTAEERARTTPGRPAPLGGRPEPYIRTHGLKDPSEWGQPDWILQGARNYPGLAPGPWMPQQADMLPIMRGANQFFSQMGSGPTALFANQLLGLQDRWTKDFYAGRQMVQQDILNQIKLTEEKRKDTFQREVRAYRDVYSAYRSDPTRMHQELIDMTYQFDDRRLRDVLQTQGLKQGLEMMSDRVNWDLDQQKLMHQIAQTEEARAKVREADRHEEIAKLLTGGALPGVQEYRDSLEPAGPLGDVAVSTDPTATPGSGGVRSSPWLTDQIAKSPRAAPAQPVQAGPPATASAIREPLPTGITPQNAPGRRGELIDWANRNNEPLPPSDSYGLANWVAAHSPPTPVAAPTVQGGAPATQAPRDTRFGKVPPVVFPAGLDQGTLDAYAWRWITTGRPMHAQMGGKDFTDIMMIQNEAVQQRAMGGSRVPRELSLDGWLDRLLRSMQKLPANTTTAGQQAAIYNANQQVLSSLDEAEPGLAARIRSILRGDEAMPRGGLGGNAPFAQKLEAIINRIDPTFSEHRFRDNRNTRDYWTKGQGSQKLSGAKQFILHADKFLHAIENMPNTRFTDVNALDNAIQTHLGLPYTTEFDTEFGHLVQELTRAFRGNGGALGDIRNERAILNANSSPAQMRTYVRAATELLYGSLKNMADDWNRGTLQHLDARDFIVSPEIQQALDRVMAIRLPSDAKQYRPIAEDNSLSGTRVERASPQDEAAIATLKTLPPNHPDAAALRRILIDKGLYYE